MMKKINKASWVMALLAATTFTGCNNSLDETVYSEILGNRPRARSNQWNPYAR